MAVEVAFHPQEFRNLECCKVSCWEFFLRISRPHGLLSRYYEDYSIFDSQDISQIDRLLRIYTRRINRVLPRKSENTVICCGDSRILPFCCHANLIGD